LLSETMEGKRLMKRLFVFFLMLLIAPAPIICGSANARMLYDDFSGIHIDDQKWDNQFTGYTELVREVVNGKLISKVANNLTSPVVRNNTGFQNAAAIQSIKCEITINETITDTGDGPRSFARVHGFFYNSRSSGGRAGDIWVGLFIGNRGFGLEAWWQVEEVLDDEGTIYELKGIDTLPVTGLDYDIPYTVEISYDGLNGLTFTVAGVSDVFNTGPERQRDSVSSYKALTSGVDGFTGASGIGYVSASFDNVYINGQELAYDTFDAELDNSIWANDETVIDIENGKLRLCRQGFDKRSEAAAYMTDDDASYRTFSTLDKQGLRIFLASMER
jgi:hypothetical protein